MTTIKDVAERAGVAPSTVSYVLNGSRSISAETRERVRRAVDELGYHPRASARTLRSTRTDVLALALPRTDGGQRAVDGRFAIDVSDAARRLGYDLLLTTAEEKAEGLRRVARSGLADAAVLMAVDMEDARIEVVRELAFPAALLGRPADEDALPWTDLDWEAAASLAVRTLAAAGHHRIAYLAPTEREVLARRSYALRGIAGARRGARETGAAVRVIRSTGNPARLARKLRALLTGAEPPTALAVQHASALPHILAAATAEGLRTADAPAMVVIGSLPDDPAARDLPRIELPVETMAAEATRLAVAAAEALRAAEPDGGGDRLLAGAIGHLLIPPALLPGARPLAPPRSP
ncbi:LacI family DNA-binding transcriptional regulator [Streptomyces sp. NPDC092296]|uniref:LacI family DNA-binding transcriptional regulator n=1 Tax=Streptomyces sp. NPDC092296 TaxID=3366012 RepID=UPI0037F11B46